VSQFDRPSRHWCAWSRRDGAFVNRVSLFT
jgi:hypothetical protein